MQIRLAIVGRMENLMYSVTDAAKMLGVGRSTLYELISEGRIDTVKVGRRTLVTRPAMERFVMGLSASQRGQRPASNA